MSSSLGVTASVKGNKGVRLPKFQYFEPKNVEEATALLSEYRGRASVLAGGTDVLVLMKQRLIQPEYLVNIRRLRQLDYIHVDEKDVLRIGAATTLEAISNSPVIRNGWTILAQAASKVAALQIRNVGTIGGNICQSYRCWYHNQSYDWHRSSRGCLRHGGGLCLLDQKAAHCQMVCLSDVAPTLIALGASMKAMRSNEERVVAARQFLGRARNSLRSDEILTEIQIPHLSQQTFGAYLKFSARKAIDYPIVGVAVLLSIGKENGLCKEAKIVCGAATPIPFEIAEAESLLKGSRIGPDVIGRVTGAVTREVAAKAVRSIDVAAVFKSQIAGILVKQGIEQSLALSRQD